MCFFLNSRNCLSGATAPETTKFTAYPTQSLVSLFCFPKPLLNPLAHIGICPLYDMFHLQLLITKVWSSYLIGQSTCWYFLATIGEKRYQDLGLTSLNKKGLLDTFHTGQIARNLFHFLALGRLEKHILLCVIKRGSLQFGMIPDSWTRNLNWSSMLICSFLVSNSGSSSASSVSILPISLPETVASNSALQASPVV